jgi:maltose O-acetyltransferase
MRGEQDVTQLARGGVMLGARVFIARRCYFDPGFGWLIAIGDDTTIGPNVMILAHDAAPKLRTGYSRVAAVSIGRRVFIGANSTILPGVTVGDDAIIGAGSVVRHDVRPGTVVVGSPAQETGMTDDHTRHHLAEVQRRPRYAVANSARTTPGDWCRMRDELGSGPGYVE